jgi:cell division septum initiation protein DivIVA
VLAYLRVNLQLVADGEHALARTLVSVAPSEELARRSQTFHDRLLEPLRSALEELGAPDPETTTELLNALVHTASRLIEQTGELERAYDATAALVDGYLRTLG